MATFDIDSEAMALTDRLAVGKAQKYGLGTFTAAVYDTAWVSMVSRPVDGEVQFLFPECFQYLLDTQMADGGWESYGNFVDGVLNTIAALLALTTRISSPLQQFSDIEKRVELATVSLQTKLDHWDVSSSNHVGFEILVPSLLLMLEEEKISFEYPGKGLLMSLNRQKLKQFTPDILYSNTKTTLLHSLEAFIGKVDFNRLKHHRNFGSMMASPSSTVAYLMNTTEWDEEAEEYIRACIAGSMGNGSVPSAYPTTTFEITWALSTLLLGGFSVETLGDNNLFSLANYLEQQLLAQDGCTGFVESVLADSDDTSKAILTLSLLGRYTSPQRLLTLFGANGSFQTYVGERNASFSANCNVLHALLYCEDLNQYVDCISKLLKFLCDTWWKGEIKDKWNLSPEYSMLLLTSALIRLLQHWDHGLLLKIQQPDIYRAMIVLAQIAIRILFDQNVDGSWGLIEVTAYNVSTLAALASLPILKEVSSQISLSISSGKSFLAKSDESWSEPQYLWIEKVTYGSENLLRSYCLAALKVQQSQREWKTDTINLAINSSQVNKLFGFYTKLPQFAIANWKVKASIIEGCLFIPQLKAARLEIFPTQIGAPDTYLAYIPIAWILSNNFEGTMANNNLLWDMMEMSLLDYLVDEYMESVVAHIGFDDLPAIEAAIILACSPTDQDLQRNDKKRQVSRSGSRTLSPSSKRIYLGSENGLEHAGESTTSNVEEQIDSVLHKEYLLEIQATFCQYIQYFDFHPRIRDAPPSEQKNLRHKLQDFLLAHLIQVKDNQRFCDQGSNCVSSTIAFASPTCSYHSWVRTTAAEHTSAPLSFAFYTSLLRSASRTYSEVSSPYEKYLVQELSSHLAIMSRLYNDFSSIERDRHEKNINSVNFPEFHVATIGRKDKDLREELLKLASYERECVTMTFKKLEKYLTNGVTRGRKTAKYIKLFVAVTELFGDIYVLKDLTNAVK